MPEKQPAPESNDSAEAKPSGKLARIGSWLHWKNLVTLRNISGLLCLSVLINMAVFFSSGEQDKKTSSKREVTLGEFYFMPDPSEETPIARADFKLHISLLGEVEELTRHRLDDHQFRVQQSIEELLRQAHGGDFIDPKLAELKRQLQERINDSISVRGISDVLITDLQLTLRDPRPMTTEPESALGSTIPGTDLSLPGRAKDS